MLRSAIPQTTVLEFAMLGRHPPAPTGPSSTITRVKYFRKKIETHPRKNWKHTAPRAFTHELETHPDTYFDHVLCCYPRQHEGLVKTSSTEGGALGTCLLGRTRVPGAFFFFCSSAGKENVGVSTSHEPNVYLPRPTRCRRTFRRAPLLSVLSDVVLAHALKKRVSISRRVSCFCACTHRMHGNIFSRVGRKKQHGCNCLPYEKGSVPDGAQAKLLCLVHVGMKQRGEAV